MNEKRRTENLEREQKVLSFLGSRKGSLVTISDVVRFLNYDLSIYQTRNLLEKLSKQNKVRIDVFDNFDYYSLIVNGEGNEPIVRSADDKNARKIQATVENMTFAINAKEKLLEASRSMMPVIEYKHLEIAYKDFIKSYEDYHLAALNSTSALLSQRDALKSKKVDPAIAGGIAQGIAGVGAGIYSAASQVQRNMSIEEARMNASSQVASANAKQTRAKGWCEHAFYVVMAHVNAYPELETLFLEEKSRKDKPLKTKEVPEKEDGKKEEKKSRLSKWLFG